MNAPAKMTDERPFQMNAQRTGPARSLAIAAGTGLDRIRQPLQRTQSCFPRRGYGGWIVAGYTVLRECPGHRRQGLGIVLHDVEARAAMNMQIDVSRSNDA